MRAALPHREGETIFSECELHCRVAAWARKTDGLPSRPSLAATKQEILIISLART